MRSLAALFVVATTLVACGDGSTSPGDDEPEVPRGPYQLLVERYSRAGERSYYTMALDGSLVAPFDGIPEDARLLVPSPDGRTIAYLRSTPDNQVHIWLMDRDGGNRRALLDGEWVVEHVAWSPDGSKLVFEATTATDYVDIWVMRADGTGLQHSPQIPSPRSSAIARLRGRRTAPASPSPPAAQARRGCG